jgi:hypothetical protein
VWQNFRADGILTNVQDIERVLGAVRALRMIPSGTWLQSNMVYTLDSPDIDQWIDLLYTIAQYGAQEGSKYPFNGGADGSDDGSPDGSVDGLDDGLQYGATDVSEDLFTNNGEQGRRSVQTRYELRPRR